MLQDGICREQDARIFSNMKIAAISDTHGQLGPIRTAPECDVLVIAGDICPDFEPSARGSNVVRQRNWLRNDFNRACVEVVESGRVGHIVLTPGNHDWVFSEPIGADSFSTGFFPDNVHFVNDTSVVIDGVKFYGTPWSLQFFDWAFMSDDLALKSVYAKMPNDVDVLVSHGPLHNHGDDVVRVIHRGGRKLEMLEHVGSKALAARVAEVMPKYVFTGHIHDASHKVFTMNLAKPVNVVNVSVLDDAYNVVRQAFTCEHEFSACSGQGAGCGSDEITRCKNKKRNNERTK